MWMAFNIIVRLNVKSHFTHVNGFEGGALAHSSDDDQTTTQVTGF